MTIPADEHEFWSNFSYDVRIVKGMTGPMKNKLEKYIDRCLIDEHADKDLKLGYSLEVQSLSEHELSNFLNHLIQHDQYTKDLVLDRMQELIDQRLDRLEQIDKYDAGLKPIIDQVNGEVTWIKRGAA